MPKCGVVLAGVKAGAFGVVFGWPAASLDLGSRRHWWAAVPGPDATGRVDVCDNAAAEARRKGSSASAGHRYGWWTRADWRGRHAEERPLPLRLVLCQRGNTRSVSGAILEAAA